MAFWALASGVVGELNNIQREKAKVAYEEQKRSDDFDYAVKTAQAEADITLETEQKKLEMLAGKQQTENLLSIFQYAGDAERARMLQIPEIRNSLAEAIGVENFGDADFSSLLIDSEDTTPLGKATLPFVVDTGKDESVFAGVDRFELYLAENPEFIDMVKEDEATKRAVTAYVGTLYNNYNAFWHNKFSQVDGDGLYSSHAYRDFSKGLSRFSGLAKQLGIINQDGFKTSPVDIGKDKIFFPQTSDNVNNYGSVISLDAIAEQYGTNPENITELSAYHGMTQGASQLYSNIDYLTYGDDATTELQDLMTDDDKMQAIALGSALLSAGAKDIMLLSGGASTATLDETTRILTIAGQGSAEINYADEDVGAMRRAYFVITKPDSMHANQLPNHLTGVDGASYAKSQGYDVKGFREQNSATDESVEMLRELVRLQTQYGATGIVAKIEAFGLGVVGQAKQIGEIFGSSDPAYDEFNMDLDPNTNAGMLMETATKVLRLSRVEQLSKMDALKLTLAAKMARAVDPSGRLSNQDFEIQLQRLGSTEWFSDQKGVLTKLNTVLEEFERRQTSNQDLLSIINKSNITVEDRRFIKASNAVNKVAAHRRKRQVRAETAAEPGDVVPKPEMEMIPVPGSDGFFTKKGDNSVIFDAAGNDVTEQWLEANYSDTDQGK